MVVLGVSGDYSGGSSYDVRFIVKMGKIGGLSGGKVWEKVSVAATVAVAVAVVVANVSK